MKQYTLEELKKELFRIESLTEKEKDIIYVELKKYSGDGGISYMEFYNIMMKLRREYKISQIDEKHLRELLEYLKE